MGFIVPEVRVLERELLKPSGDHLITEFSTKHFFEPYCGRFDILTESLKFKGVISVSDSAFFTKSKNKTFGRIMVHI